MPTTRICLRLLLLTGARRDDWAEASKFELHDGCLAVPAERYKTKRIHQIPLGPLAQEQVRPALRLDPASEWLFPSLGAFGPKSAAGRMNSAVVTESMGRLMTRLGIPHATPHSLRHTVGSHLDRLGYALEEIALALGHKLKGTTAGYIHDKDDRRAAGPCGVAQSQRWFPKASAFGGGRGRAPRGAGPRPEGRGELRPQRHRRGRTWT